MEEISLAQIQMEKL